MAPGTTPSCPTLDGDVMRPLSPGDSTGEVVQPHLLTCPSLLLVLAKPCRNMRTGSVPPTRWISSAAMGSN